MRTAVTATAAAVVAAVVAGCGSGPGPVTESYLGTLSALDPPAAPGSLAPSLAVSDEGPLLTWLEPAADGGEGFRLRLSKLGGAGWSEPGEIISGKRLLAGWADPPAVVQAAGGELAGHWLARRGSMGSAVHGLRSADGGASWRQIGLLHDDVSPTEHGFVSYAPSADGVRVFWLDGRRMLGGGPTELRTAMLGDEAMPPATVLDGRVCECCTTDAAQTSAGAIVVYRDRDDDEVRDIAVVRATGDGWSEPRTVHRDGWRINGCPVNGPAVAAAGDRVAVAWFTAPGGETRVKVAFSADAGASFAAPAVVDRARPLGRVDVALDQEGHAVVLWVGTVDEEKAELRLARVAPSGAVGEARVIAETSPKRSSGMPRMVRDGGRLVIAWTEVGRPSRVRAGVVPLG